MAAEQGRHAGIDLLVGQTFPDSTCWGATPPGRGTVVVVAWPRSRGDTRESTCWGANLPGFHLLGATPPGFHLLVGHPSWAERVGQKGCASFWRSLAMASLIADVSFSTSKAPLLEIPFLAL